MNIRVPGIDSAIKYLRPNARWEVTNSSFTRYEDPDYDTPPSWDEVIDQLNKDIAAYNYYQYARDREKEYGGWQEQLNLLFDDITSGNLENGKWVSMIKEIKNKYPKPD